MYELTRKPGTVRFWNDEATVCLQLQDDCNEFTLVTTSNVTNYSEKKATLPSSKTMKFRFKPETAKLKIVKSCKRKLQ